MIRTSLPSNFYSLFFKVIVLSVILVLSIENYLLAIALGLFSGIILHFCLSYYDCIIHLENGWIKFYFIRPFLIKEKYDLQNLDMVEIIREDKEKTLKDIWLQADMLIPIGYDSMKLSKGGIIKTIKFRANEKDLPQLEAAILGSVNRKVEV